MKDRKDLSNAFLFTAAKHATYMGKDEAHNLQFQRNIVGYLIFAGAEAVSVVFRKNHNRSAINKGALVVACIVFAACSGFSFLELSKDGLTDSEQNKNFIRGVSYGLITILVMWQGYEKYRKATINSEFSMGQSYLQAFFGKEVKNHDLILYVYEPILIIAIGIMYSLYDLVGGLPIIFSGLSTWVLAILVKAILGNPTQQKVNASESKNNSSDIGFTS